jgi:chromate transporter
MQKLKDLGLLFFCMLKIGLFTFGGGYAMISLLENEFVGKRGWLEHDEFMDLVAIAESTPGPIAINCATYLGYKKGKLLGAALATVGMVLPSLSIIYLISLFFDRFLSIAWVASAFRGIQVCVIFLILSAGLKMLKKMKKTVFSCTVMALTFTCMTLLGLLAVDFSSIFYILISGAAGLLVYGVCVVRGRKRAADSEVER